MAMNRMTAFRVSSLGLFLSKHMKTSILMGVGDYVAQKYFEKQDQYCTRRTIRFMAVGLFVMGPALSKWYEVLDRLVPSEKSSIKRGMKKMVIDQFGFGPFFSLFLMGIFGLINNDDSATLKARFTEDYPAVMKFNYKIWPALQVINFTLIPTPLQVYFVQFAAILSNAILATIVNKS